MAKREMESETVAVRIDSQPAQEIVKEEQVHWIEDEVEELERWDGLE